MLLLCAGLLSRRAVASMFLNSAPLWGVLSYVELTFLSDFSQLRVTMSRLLVGLCYVVFVKLSLLFITSFHIHFCLCFLCLSVVSEWLDVLGVYVPVPW